MLTHARSTGPRPGGPDQPRMRPTTRGKRGASCALTVRSPRAAHTRVGAVTRSTAARWGLASGKVSPASTGGVPGWRRARRAETGLTEEVRRRWGGGKWPVRRCSGGRAALTGWRRPQGGPTASGGGGEMAAGVASKRDEKHGAGGGGIRPAAGGSTLLKGSGGEAERERDGGLAWRGVRAGGALPRDSGERRGRRDAGRRGLQVGRDATGGRLSALRCGAGQHGEAVGAALTGGVGNTMRPIQFSNRIKFISNGFKFASNFDRSKQYLPVLQKFQIKYG
jgi:hypothetical protein